MPNKSKQQIGKSKYPLTQDEVSDIFLHLQAFRFTSNMASGHIKRQKDGRFSATHQPLYIHTVAATELGMFLTPYEAYKAIIDFAHRVWSENKALALQYFHNESLRNEFIVK